MHSVCPYGLLRKEVIQPHLPIRLPCYDFTPIIYPTLGGEYGIIAFLFYDGVKKIDYEEAQDEVYAVLLSKLAKEKSLIKRGKLLIHLDIVTYAPNISESKVQENDGFTVCNNDNALSEYFKILHKDNQEYYEYAMRCIQSIGTMKKVLSREKAKTENSRGWILKNLEAKVANLDKIQMSAAPR